MNRKSTLLVMLATLACAIGFGVGTVRAQFPHTVSYQGYLNQGTVPAVGPVTLTINYYNASTNVLLSSETFSNVVLNNGIFSIQLGSQNPMVLDMFNAATPIELGVHVNGGAELSPRTKLSATPYSFTSYSLLGIPASLTPVNNTFFPLPVDGDAHIGTEVLPPVTLNGKSLYETNMRIVGGRNVTVNSTANTITIDGPATPTITNVAGGAGIVTSQSNGTVTVAANADPQQFGYINNALHLRTDIPVIGTDAHFRSLLVDQDTRMGGGLVCYGLQTGALLTTDAATIGGNLYLKRDLYAQNDVLSIHAPVINFNGGRLTGIPYPLEPQDLANKGYIDQQDYATSLLGGDLRGTTGSAEINPGNEGVGDRIVDGINLGAGSIMDERVADDLTIYDGRIDATPLGNTEPATARVTTLTSLDQTALATDGGNVGIGITVPQHLLDIRADQPQLARAQIWNSGGNATIGAMTEVEGTASLELGDDRHNTGSIRINNFDGMQFRMTDQSDGETFVIPEHKLMTLGWHDNIDFSASTLNFGDVRLQYVADPIELQDAATKNYVDSVAMLSGDVIGSVSNNTLNARAEGIGDRMILAINHASDQIAGLRVNPNFDNMDLTAGRARMRVLHLYDGANTQQEALVVHQGGLVAAAPHAQEGLGGDVVSDRFADVVIADGASVTIHNSLVHPNSVIMLTLEVKGANDYSGRVLLITDIQEGQFTVKAGRFGFASGSRVHYMIINSGSNESVPN